MITERVRLEGGPADGRELEVAAGVGIAEIPFVPEECRAVVVGDPTLRLGVAAYRRDGERPGIMVFEGGGRA